MKPTRNSISNPLSFSVLDMVMGLVGVILIVSFALAAQPAKKSNRSIQGYIIQITLEARREFQGVGVAIFHGNEWHLPSDDNTVYTALIPSVYASTQLLHMKKKMNSNDALIVYLNFNPKIENTTESIRIDNVSVTLSCNSDEKSMVVILNDTFTSERLSKTFTGQQLIDSCGWTS